MNPIRAFRNWRLYNETVRELNRLNARQLNDLGIKHGGIVDAPYGSGLSFRDPDNIALELFAPPG